MYCKTVYHSYDRVSLLFYWRLFQSLKNNFISKLIIVNHRLLNLLVTLYTHAEYSLIWRRRGRIWTIVCRKLNSCSANSFKYGGKCPVKTIFSVRFLKCSLQKSLLDTIYTLLKLNIVKYVHKYKALFSFALVENLRTLSLSFLNQCFYLFNKHVCL